MYLRDPHVNVACSLRLISHVCLMWTGFPSESLKVCSNGYTYTEILDPNVVLSIAATTQSRGSSIDVDNIGAGHSGQELDGFDFTDYAGYNSTAHLAFNQEEPMILVRVS